MYPPSVGTRCFAAADTFPLKGGRDREFSLGYEGAHRFDIDGVDRGTAAHEEAVSLLAAEAEIGAGLRQMDLADEIAVRRIAAHTEFVGIAAAERDPDIAVHIRAHAVGASDRAEGRDEDLVVGELV